ncbi:UNVERIFIED_CONTAM: hypothetical protein Sindi_2464700 [Sesamum indicum]
MDSKLSLPSLCTQTLDVGGDGDGGDEEAADSEDGSAGASEMAGMSSNLMEFVDRCRHLNVDKGTADNNDDHIRFANPLFDGGKNMIFDSVDGNEDGDDDQGGKDDSLMTVCTPAFAPTKIRFRGVATPFENMVATGSAPARIECPGIIDDGGRIPMEKEVPWSKEGITSRLGFRDGINGGRVNSSSPAEFNINEFLKLAYRVVEGDTSSMAALRDLQIRWEEKFGSGYVQPVSVRMYQPLRCLIPVSLTRKQTGEIHIPPEQRASASETVRSRLQTGILQQASKSRLSGDLAVVPVTKSVPSRRKGDVDAPSWVVVHAAVADDSDGPSYGDGDVACDLACDEDEDVARFVGDVNGHFEKGVINAGGADKIIHDEAATSPVFGKVNSSATSIFVGNIPLHACPEPFVEDKIADAFNKSSRTLSYIAPTIQNGEVIVRPTLETIKNGSRRWRSTAVVYFLGKRPYFHHLKELRHLPVELWTKEGLSTVASGVGKPLYPDAITRACTRLDFARVCVMLGISSKLPKHIIIMMPDENGGESPCKIDVEYEWVPPRCTTCMTLGHSVKHCTENRVAKQVEPLVAVYVRKVGASKPNDQDMNNHQSINIDKSFEDRDEQARAMGPGREDKGKATVTYNAFEALHLLYDTDILPGGPNRCRPTSLKP